MISIVLYGRNDDHGYNLHKRAALAINCMAEVLSDPTDEILFVDYNTTDDHPTLPEAIADTLTETAVARLRILRARPVIHQRVSDRTHLKVVEPIARNVAVRRSNPANRWILSTNADMILVPRGASSLSDVVRTLPDGFYHLPRFDVPESLWEGFDRREPRAVMARIREYGRSLFLNEVVVGSECIRYDAPGDFQLMLRSDLFRFDGFNEEMLLGWHVDFNIARRLFLAYGAVGDARPYVYGYHCDHTRRLTPAHTHKAAKNDPAVFVDGVSAPDLPSQRDTWGCPHDLVEELTLRHSSHAHYVRGLGEVLHGEWAEPAEVRYTPDSYDRHGYDARHVLPFLGDLFATAPRTLSVGWFGGRPDLFELFCGLWGSWGFAGQILIERWTAALVAPAPPAAVQVERLAAMAAAVDVWVIDFSVPSDSAGPFAFGQEGWIDDAIQCLVERAFGAVTALERARVAEGRPPRRIICIDAVHNRYEALVNREIDAASTPFSSRLRHGFVVARDAGVMPPSKPGAVPTTNDRQDVLPRLGVATGGRPMPGGVQAPLGQRGYVFRGQPYEQLQPGRYEVEIAVAHGRLLGIAASLRPVIVEIVGAGGLLAVEHAKVVGPCSLRVTFEIPQPHPESIEVRLFRGRLASFAVTAVHLWRLPPFRMPPMRPSPSAATKPIADALAQWPAGL